MYDALAAHEGGNAFLRGPSDLGVNATAQITDRVEAVATVAGVRPFVSVDQEGGNAQALEGAGFSEMPTALTQGGQEHPDLRRDAKGWAGELLSAGVNLDLAPVADVVPAEIGGANGPIGYFRRQYGYTPQEVAPAVRAFVRGMQEGDVATSIKHFPGLGRATGNTDSDPTATDPTVRGDALLEPFAQGVRADAAFTMVSSANYPGIDPDNRACFSRVVIHDMLRGDLGFEGVVVSDSFGSASVSSLPAGRRAVRFFRAGGTMVLDTNYLDLEPMSAAVLARMERDPAFAELIESDVRLVLTTKERFGLVDGGRAVGAAPAGATKRGSTSAR
jgi:beta-N-acetylhexosaminidase